MSFFLSFKGRVFVFALLSFVGGIINGNAQSPAAVDPLTSDYKFFQRNGYDPARDFSTSGAATLQKNNSSATAGELDPTLNLNIDFYPGNARAVASQPDGKILVGGFFRTVNGTLRKNIVRLNADYSLDQTFSADVNGTVFAVAVQPDGKIVIGGSFISVGGANRSRIARLNADGSLDTTFNPGAGALNGLVYDVALQSDGKILLGGNFYGVGAANNYGIARLNADGSPDFSFVSPIPAPTPTPFPPFQTPSIVYSIAVQPSDGKIVIGGFVILSYASSTPPSNAILRLNTNGSVDSSFNAGNINSNALRVVIQPDGKILLAGSFTTINGVSRKYLVRLNQDGSVDASFDMGTGANLPVYSVAVQPDGKIVLVGLFTQINGVARSRYARVNADGSLDTGFNQNNGFLTGNAQSVIVLANGKVVVAGSFAATGFANSDAVKILNADGSADSTFVFTTTATGGVLAIAQQTDGKTIVGGYFTRINGVARNQLARINQDGTLDETFGSSPIFSSSSGTVNSIIIQPDGKILVGGVNVSTGGSSFGVSVARFNADGTVDGSFVQGNIPTSRGINALALQPDGKVVVAFGYAQNNGFPVGGVSRLNADGSIDDTFSAGVPSGVIYNSIAIQPDGKILVGMPGSFGYINSQTGSVFYNGLVRLNANGSQDTVFVPAFIEESASNRYTQSYALALQPDGKILVGGRIYTNNNPTQPVGAARLNADGTLDVTFNSGALSSQANLARVQSIFRLPNGKILIGGLFDGIGSSARTNAARLNADGSIDSAFNASTDNTIYKITAQMDGKVLIGGEFEFVNAAPRTSLARLLSEPTATRTRFDFDGDGKADVSTFRPTNSIWYLQNSSAGFSAAQFGISTDKIVPADYDGDGKTDLAVYRSGVWYLQRSQLGFTGIQFGASDDIPVPADFDADGKAELTVFRPSNGVWYSYNLTTNQTNAVQFGANGDKPIAADFDADGKADYAVFRPSTATWYLQRSSLGFTGIQFGNSTDKPVAADYDADGKTDIAVFRAGVWYLQRSSLGFTGIQFGLADDVPVPADFDGDGKADLAVFRNGFWYIQRTAQGFTGVQFGTATDQPIPAAFIQ